MLLLRAPVLQTLRLKIKLLLCSKLKTPLSLFLPPAFSLFDTFRMENEAEFVTSTLRTYYADPIAEESATPITPDCPQVGIVGDFCELLQQSQREPLRRQIGALATCIQVDFESMAREGADRDWASAAFSQPEQVLRCLGVALCVLRRRWSAAPSQRRLPKLVPVLVNVAPLTAMSSLKSSLRGQLVAVRGNVTRVTAVRPLVVSADYVCKCGSRIPTAFVDGVYAPPTQCSNGSCRCRYFTLDRSSAVTVDSQLIKLQELENELAEAGRIPRMVECELRKATVESAIPGDIVTVVGTVKLNEEEGGRHSARDKANSVFTLRIAANSVQTARQSTDSAQEEKRPVQQPDRGGGSSELTAADLHSLQRLLHEHRPYMFELLVHSLCPAIFGQHLVKAGLLLALFGGAHQREEQHDHVPCRTDPHVLIVGDPGLGKSQILQAVSVVAPRSVYICGNTTSTTGLTVTLVKDKDSKGDFGLEAGALVLADQGICCIDEFDKMGIDYSSLLEAMEQQRISIAKAGIVCSLSARCSVVAAANPAGGHYNKGKTVSENLKMSGALLSRFDLVFVILDQADLHRDRCLSEHVMALHTRQRRGARPPTMSASQSSAADAQAHETVIERLDRTAVDHAHDPLPIELMRKYIAYAREHVHPRLSAAAAGVLQTHYLEMRASAHSGDSVPVTTRQLESLIRLAQARAKIEMRETVSERDAKDVVEIMRASLSETRSGEDGVTVMFSRNGGTSLPKMVKAFVAELSRQADANDSSIFTQSALCGLVRKMDLKVKSVPDFVELLCTECYLLKKGGKKYSLTTSVRHNQRLSQAMLDC